MIKFKFNIISRFKRSWHSNIFCVINSYVARKGDCPPPPIVYYMLLFRPPSLNRMSRFVTFLSFCFLLKSSPGKPALLFIIKKYIVLDSLIIKRREEKPMEEPHSMNSPRTILIFSKRGRTTTTSVSFVDPNDEKSNSGEHGPKPSEVYGFVGSITTVVATAFYLAWAYIPVPWLRSIGIFYYPSRYWALAVPTYAMVIIVLAFTFYIGLNFMSTPPLTSLTTMFDEFSREPSSFLSHMEGYEQPIEPISDLGIDKINVLMFGVAK